MQTWGGNPGGVITEADLSALVFRSHELWFFEGMDVSLVGNNRSQKMNFM